MRLTLLPKVVVMSVSILLLTAFFNSCDVVEAPSTASSTSSGGGSSQSAGQSAAWATSNGYVDFKSSATTDYGNAFLQSYSGSFTAGYSVSGKIKRVSGSLAVGDGFMWGYQDSDNFYALLLDGQGDYMLLKYVSGYETDITSWSTSSYILTGLNAANSISIAYYSGYYKIYINGNFLTSFYRDATLGTNGAVGFWAGVGDSSTESFPGTPVELQYQLSSPVTEP